MNAIMRVLLGVCVGLWSSVALADPSCAGQGELSLAGSTRGVAEYEIGKTVVLTDLTAKPALEAPIKDNDAAKACVVAKDHFDAFRKAFDKTTVSDGKLSFELPKSTGCLAFKVPQGAELRIKLVERCKSADVVSGSAPSAAAAGTTTAGTTTAQPTAAGAVTAAPTTPAECAASVLSPALENQSVIKDLRCSRLAGDELTLCVNLLGRPIGPALPPLREGQTVLIKLVAPTSFQGGAQLHTRFERTLIVGQAKIETLRQLTGDFTAIEENKVALRSKGKLHVSVTRQAGTATNLATTPTSACTVPATTTPTTLTLEVSGHYFFSAGVMVAYTHLQQRSFSRQTGDDGVVRIGQQDSSGLDYVINVVGFPWGVDDEQDRVAAGILFGTSAGSLGKRWYAGAELSSPIGLGLSGGAAISIVKKLDEPLVAGQPFSGDQLATHDVAEPTWYVGVNLQAALFEAAFGALFDDDDDDDDDDDGGGTQ